MVGMLVTCCGPERPVYRPDPDPGPPPAAARPVTARARPVTAPAQVQTRGKGAGLTEVGEVWVTRCATCHGLQGRGDGTSAGILATPPRDLANPHWQGSVTDEHIARIIVEGSGAVGLSQTMPANPDLGLRPGLVGALVGLVRELKIPADRWTPMLVGPPSR